MVPMLDGGIVETVNHLLHFPEELEKLVNPSRSHSNHHEERKGSNASVPADILQTSREYVFLLDVPGLSKSDIQVTVEDEKTLVLKGQGKRKREEKEEDECRYIRLERKTTTRFARKFTLPEDANVSAISAKCENGVLSVTVARNPPAKKATIDIPIS